MTPKNILKYILPQIGAKFNLFLKKYINAKKPRILFSRRIRQQEIFMDKKTDKSKVSGVNDDSVSGRYSEFTGKNAIPGINTPGIELPAFNPPVPNRAWTAMRMGIDVDELDDVEREEMYEGHGFD